MESSLSLPTVHSHSSAAQFLARMEPLLLAQEARYSLMLGISVRARDMPDFHKHPPYFAIAEDASGIAAAALMTPPHGIILYCERAETLPGLRAIARDLQEKGWKLPSVNGPEPVCTHFAEHWAEINGLKMVESMRERTFELRNVIHPRYSPGHMRAATPDDLPQLAQWLKDFMDEALHGVESLSLDEAHQRTQMRIEQGMLFVWEDGEVVSMTGTARPTAHGITIAPVYTPPHLRGRGYASSCVAAVSQRMLDEGRDFCALFTDLANPTSNHIYQAIGYRPICDYMVYCFE